jgi:BirA family transcriptional regulator, biotin operon repressor / biotin---[acetyl-CoA-carboxylase] ligase
MDYRIIYLESVDSTNVYLKNLCSFEKPEEGTVILADYQTKGKGQGINSWYSMSGLNITMSMLFKPKLNVSDHFFLSEFASLGIVDTLKDFGITSSIKWPNDIYVGDRKIAGILIENSLQGNEIIQTIAGIGVNVNGTDFPSYIPNPVSMKMILQKNIEEQKVLEILIGNLLKRYMQVSGQQSALLHKEYNQFLYRSGQIAEFIENNELFQATIIEVKQTGELVIKKHDRQLYGYLHGEISFII